MFHVLQTGLKTVYLESNKFFLNKFLVFHLRPSTQPNKKSFKTKNLYEKLYQHFCRLMCDCH